MKRLSFLVNRGENDCYMVHGLEWAAYVEGTEWADITECIITDVNRIFGDEERPQFLDFLFADGSKISLCA